MILAEKIAKLRKQQGWSQEELAVRLGVSRQSVSKWESMASMPDLDKIMRLSEIFNVSTDYLLKEEALDEQGYVEEAAANENICFVSLNEANAYLDLALTCYRLIALAIGMFILSPSALILLVSASENGFLAFSRELAAAVGLVILILVVASGVAVLMIGALKLNPYEYLEKEPIVTEYGVAGIVQSKKDDYKDTYHKGLIGGISFCIVSVIPIFFSAVIEDKFFAVFSVALMLLLIAIGCYLITYVSGRWSSYQKLLEEGDYTREKKEENKRNGAVTVFYWCLLTAVYLAVSLYTKSWDTTWGIWPVGSVLFFGLIALKKVFQKG